ncbi:MAG TPA: glutamate--tRNA ligase [Candidatus Baltobacteraceae bacterium]|nr:glutamate--tRNA ligase [Candidatus Baltobacteraceae bacterium]
MKTRVAPSPTGDPHVGTAYVALINYIFARKHGGSFLLRIEDTDRARSTRESERAILDSLRWLGLTWDEGPDVGGPNGPYRQSERSEIYRSHVQRLLDAGRAFKCFCTPQRLEEMREAQRAAKKPPRYDGLCMGLTPQEVVEKEAAGIPYVVRMKVPDFGVCVVHDLRRGDIVFDWNTVDMQVLMKSDGMPTYHLANVVDDHLMEITHVIRGEEWLSSAPKHLLLYQYFGWEAPALLHLPLLRNPDKSKLSKRKNPTGILFYRAMGYLPDALLNFLGLLCVPAEEGHEIMDLNEMAERFEVEHIALGGPVFDVPKLNWLNGRYIRERYDSKAFLDAVARWGFDGHRLRRIAELAQPRIERLSDLGSLVAFFFQGRVPVTAQALRECKLDDESLLKAFQLAMWGFDAMTAWDVTEIEGVLKGIAQTLGRKFRDLARPFYLAITGSPASVPLYDSIELLGRDIVRERLRHAIEVLGGVSAAQLKEWKALEPPGSQEESTAT